MTLPQSLIGERLRDLPRSALRGIRRGIEKESLRVRPDSSLALTPHPLALGSALTHHHITTDFSESQLELITGVQGDVESCLEELCQIHQFVHRSLGEDLLWAGSMPCELPPDTSIPIGFYGHSNIGRAKAVYRTGLSYRYGKRMQTISGIHYNWSMPGLGSDDCFALIRNFRRHSFLLLYLFGASPALCSGFLAGRDHGLTMVGCDTLGMPHATSLRMGRLGYQSDAQAELAVSYNGLERYAASLQEALTQQYPPYEEIGIRDRDGNYRQLATSMLQIENEFYGTIRPKRVINPGERPLRALRERGVEYVEVRCLDLDPFAPLGIAPATARFVDLLLLHSLLVDSPVDSPRENDAISRNQNLVATRGREPDLRLDRGDVDIALTDWAAILLDEFGPIADALDASEGGHGYRDCLQHAQHSMDAADLLPSARVLEAMRQDHGGSHSAFVRAQSAKAKRQLLDIPWPAALHKRFEQMAAASLDEQANIEAQDRTDFETYRQAYLAPARLQP
jgi:glutamate--cysteine ligase